MKLIPYVFMMIQLFVLREMTSLPQENKKQDRGRWSKYSGVQLNSLKELCLHMGNKVHLYIFQVQFLKVRSST